MIEVLDWILVHPLASCIIALFLMGIFSRIRFVEKTYNYYNNKNDDNNEEDDNNEN